MFITYSAKAKEDLIQLDWKLRHKIVNTMGKIAENKKYGAFVKMNTSEFYKVRLNEHLLICSFENDEFVILTVVPKKRPVFPD